MVLLAALFLFGSSPAQANPPDPRGNGLVKKAFEQLYSFHFSGAHESLDQARQSAPDDPMVSLARSAAYLFAELDRLGILSSEFFQDRGERLKTLPIAPDPKLRDALHASLNQTRRLASERLEQEPNDADAMFALTMAAGIECNYAVFVEKKRMGALPLAKRSHEHALKLIEAHPGYDDARVVTGMNEYLVSGMPFFVRWFVRFRDVDGNRQTAIEQLRRVAVSGRYFPSFAKILLAAIYIREQRWRDARDVVADLAERYPDNPLFQRELGRLNDKVPAAAAP